MATAPSRAAGISAFRCSTLRRGILAALLLALPVAIAGCNEIVQFSKRPLQQAAVVPRLTSIRTPVFVANRLPANSIAGPIDALLPERIAAIKTEARKAACVDVKGQKVCESLRITGTVSRKGGVTISGIGNTIVVEIPLAYELTGLGTGRAKSVLEKASGELRVAASLPLSLDENWGLVATAAPRIDWRSASDVAIGGGKLSLDKAVIAGLSKHLAGLRRALEQNVSTAQLKTLTETAWRQLNTPIAIAGASKLWLRGEPVSLEFAGLEFTSGEVEVRSAIITEMATFEGERPLPLIPQKLPLLTLAAAALPAPAIVVPIDVPYADIVEMLMQGLPADAVLPPRNASETALKIRSLELFPSKTHVAIGIEIEALQPGKLEGYKGRAYVVALPQLEAISGSIKLSKLVMTETAGAPRAVDGQALVVDPARIEALFADKDLLPLAATLAQARAEVSASAEHAIGEGLRLRRRVTDVHVGSIALLANALRVNVELQGDLTIISDGASLAVEDNGAASGLSSP